MREQYFTDKSSWIDGPWKSEPDRVSWIDQDTGYDCLILRNQFGSLCGYVAIPALHTFYEKDYDSINNIEVHGGLTYADHCRGTPDEHICHSTEHEDKVWWLGFDCNHFCDFSPNYCESNIRSYINIFYNYKNIEYVKEEVKSLADQLKNRESL